MEAEHLRLDLALSGSRAVASHLSECPDIGPICEVRDEPPQYHHTTLWMTELRLLAEYGLGHGWAVQGQIPLRLVDTRTRFTDLDGAPLALDYESIHHRDETLVRFGDVQLFAHGATRLAGFQLSARLGVNLPTGIVHEDPYELGHEGKPHQHLQFGTGTFDPILGVDASRQLGPFTLAAFAQGHVPLYQGPRGYQAGGRFYGGLSASLGGWLPQGMVARFSASGLHELAERWHGVVPTDDGNQGRTGLYVGPGITIPFARDWSAAIDLRLRAYGHTVNAQLDLPVVVELSIGRLLHLEGGGAEGHGRDVGEVATPIHGDVADLVTHGEAAPLPAALGKWTVIDFWAEWCEPCRVLDRELGELAASRPDVAIRRVNIVDFDSAIAKQELPGVEQIPHVRLIDPAGRVVWEATGSPDELLDEIRARIGAR
ncbi:MAG: thioredoxin family protein [Myxococcaceae bacterium]|nr:thioredoxin family protein [Myxococcaceae bacterium]